AATSWPHTHWGLQEQLLRAAPLIIRDGRDRADQQEVIVMLADFSFTPPEQIFADLRKVAPSMPPTGHSAQPAPAGAMAPAGGMKGMDKSGKAGSGGMAMGRKPDLNDVKYDAFLANDRTLTIRRWSRSSPAGACCCASSTARR